MPAADLAIMRSGLSCCKQTSVSLHVLKNWHGRFQESKLFEELFEQIVLQDIFTALTC
jgi:hypothetical protein